MSTELKARIRISRRARSNAGWILTLGKPEYSLRFPFGFDGGRRVSDISIGQSVNRKLKGD